LRVSRQDPPWKVVRAFPQPGGQALVHLHNVSGGVLAGDRLALHVDVEAGATALVTTTGATRLYRHRAGSADSEQRVNVSVGEGGLLEYLPDQVIPFAGSRHAMRTDVRLAPEAALFWWEVLAPGRQASGERFAFERLRVQTEISAGGRPVLLEDFLLDPRERPLGVAARMSEYSHLASFYAFREGLPAAFWRALEDNLNEAASPRSQPGEAIWAASALASDGVLVRGVSRTGRDIPAALAGFWGIARRAVTGQDAVPPRKTR
jgi:urease accessory protein